MSTETHGMDINNDGYDDLLLGAIYGESDKGASYLLLGGCDGAAACGGRS
jgi:hypothetical protein